MPMKICVSNMCIRVTNFVRLPIHQMETEETSDADDHYCTLYLEYTKLGVTNFARLPIHQ